MITILKTGHHERSEAKLLLPYIREADLYCPEIAVGSEEECTKLENDWDEVLGAGYSLTKYRRVSQERMQRGKMGPFMNLEREYCFRGKLPIRYIQRFPDKELIEKEYTRFRELQHKSRTLLRREDLEGYLSNQEEIFHILVPLMFIRDLEMARNLDTIEAYAVEKTGKDNPHVVCAVGSSHEPEVFMQKEAKVVSLTPPGDLLERIAKGFFDGREFHMRIKDELIDGIYTMDKQGNLNLESMTEAELRAVLAPTSL